MKTKIKYAVLLTLPILGSSLLVSCHSHDRYHGNYQGSVSLGYSSGGIYDSYGFPIFGYMGGRPVYGYNAYGSPIFSFTYIRNKCYVPSWGPASHYRGHYKYPSHVHRVGNLPHHGKGWKAPAFDKNRPNINNRPNRGASNHGRNNNMYVTNPSGNSRPGTNGRGSSSYNRPAHTEKPFNKPSSPNQPNHGFNRPSTNSRPESIQKPSVNNRPSTSNNRPAGVERPANRPSVNAERPSSVNSNYPRTRPDNTGSAATTRPSYNQSPSSDRMQSSPSGGSRPSVTREARTRDTSSTASPRQRSGGREKTSRRQ